MRKLGDLANDCGVECIGAYVNQNGFANVVTAIEATPLPHLGRTATIGSGAKELMNLCKDIDEFFERNPVADASRRGAMAAGLIQNHALVEEIFGADRSWGGYLEILEFNGTRWDRGPRKLHQFRVAVQVSPGVATVQTVGRLIAYDPVGRILGVGYERGRLARF
jgi:hypothetical protein